MGKSFLGKYASFGCPSQAGVITEVPTEIVFPDTSGILVGNMPTVDLSPVTNVNLSNHTSLAISGNCSEEGQVVSVDIGSLNFNPTCTSGTYSTGPQDISSLADRDINIDVNQSDGTNNAPSASATTTKDTSAPTVSSVSPLANDLYKIGDQIDFNVSFDEIVNVSGSPKLTLTVGTITKDALYVSGDGTSSLVFRYIVASGDEDLDGISFNSNLIDLNSGYYVPVLM